jgi:hypothetical protein
MTGLPAISPSVGLVMSRSSPMSLFSPGAPLGQSSIMFDGSPAKELERAHRPKQMITSKRVNEDVMSRSEIISGATVEVFFWRGRWRDFRIPSLRNGEVGTRRVSALFHLSPEGFVC